jgi:hypothetical protein
MLYLKKSDFKTSKHIFLTTKNLYMPVKIKAAVDKIKAAVIKIKAANSIEKIKAAELPDLVKDFEEYLVEEEENGIKVKAALIKIKAVVEKIKANSSEQETMEEYQEMISFLNEVDSSELINLIYKFGGTNGISLDHDLVANKSMQELMVENAAWRRIVTKLQLEVDSLEHNGN